MSAFLIVVIGLWAVIQISLAAIKADRQVRAMFHDPRWY